MNCVTLGEVSFFSHFSEERPEASTWVVFHSLQNDEKPKKLCHLLFCFPLWFIFFRLLSGNWHLMFFHLPFFKSASALAGRVGLHQTCKKPKQAACADPTAPDMWVTWVVLGTDWHYDPLMLTPLNEQAAVLSETSELSNKMKQKQNCTLIILIVHICADIGEMLTFLRFLVFQSPI